MAEQINALVAQHKPRVLALDLSRVPDIEYSALQVLMDSEQRATERGTVMWLVGLNPGVLEVARRAGLDKRLERERMLFNARRGNRTLSGDADGGRRDTAGCRDLIENVIAARADRDSSQLRTIELFPPIVGAGPSACLLH